MPLTQPTDLSRKIEKAGYYPDLVADVLDVALAGEEVLAHLVHGETTFDLDTIRRHLSVVVLTPGRLIFVHADDHGGTRSTATRRTASRPANRCRCPRCVR